MVSTCSYEARGVRGALGDADAHRGAALPQCGVSGDGSPQILPGLRGNREIFHTFTDLVEPVSIDEAYLDVTENKRGMESATRLAREIQREIFLKTKLTPPPESPTTSFWPRSRRT